MSRIRRVAVKVMIGEGRAGFLHKVDFLTLDEAGTNTHLTPASYTHVLNVQTCPSFPPSLPPSLLQTHSSFLLPSLRASIRQPHLTPLSTHKHTSARHTRTPTQCAEVTQQREE